MRPLNSLTKTIFLTAAMIYLTGCGWTPETSWWSPVFSDDDQGVAMFEQNREVQRNIILHGSGSATRYTDFQVHIGPVGEALAPVGPPLEGQAQALYYMGSAGYVVLARTVKVDDEHNAWIVNRIDTATGVSREVTRTTAPTTIDCDPNDGSAFGGPNGVKAVPSPDGALIAVMVNTADCQGTQSTLRFLDGQTLEQVAPQQTAFRPYDPQRGPGHAELSWLPDGRVVASNDALFFNPNSVMAYTPGGEPEVLEGVPQDCFYPATTSSDTRADGQRVVERRDGEYALEPGGTVYGCDL